ncbi:hypothetical protein DFA_04391 [Cavenderia fasciculata]|uniref:Uncharacterized protein n=1 Tax=Cavenderia fasciculata TaxID=261658 RepID=F4PPG0_CACFS|nr:uncharacterized protein DFA_04391 [Cavenderia fasciculata]EGG22273.1 hypothetical protein DFA_04391 [Cavenderia fasciculata]|eukprot:XP_004360124.1 hypothetical protein DFA_04391 [Cavenderia fasciculata]
MTKNSVIDIYLSIDKNIYANEYINPKWSDQVKDKIREAILNKEQIDKSQPLNVFAEASAATHLDFNGRGGRGGARGGGTQARRGIITKPEPDTMHMTLHQLHSKEMGFEPDCSEITYNLYTLDDIDESSTIDVHSKTTMFQLQLTSYESPILHNMCSSGEIIQQVIIRHYQLKEKSRVLRVEEYELGFSKVHTVATFGNDLMVVFVPSFITTTFAKIKVDSGEYKSYSMSRVDYILKDRNKRSILPIDPTNPQILDDAIQEDNSHQILKDRNVNYSTSPPPTTQIFVQQPNQLKIYKRLDNIELEISFDHLITRIATLLGLEKNNILNDQK